LAPDIRNEYTQAVHVAYGCGVYEYQIDSPRKIDI
jgi:hypothetical protein